MKLQEIIDEIWEENQDKFNSRKELEYIINGYLRGFHEDLKNIRDGKLSVLGTYHATKYGTSYLKRKAKAKKKRQLAKQRIYFRTVWRAWRLKFIEDSFPD